jgi:ATP-dependent helicase HrpB
MSGVQSLPIDGLLGEAVGALARAASLVIEAPPGAGKTTRVPPALLDAGAAGAGEVWVLEPRRLAARLSARRVAEERGESLGETVGYQVRFEEAAGPRTRIRFLTEGVLTRRLLSDPLLERAGVVILDEFHERHLQADLALALLKRLQRERRPDLRLVAMSATLDAAPLARYLDDCPVLRSEGRRFEVAVEHLARPDERPLEEQVEGAVRRLCAEGLDGDVLVFLPGAAAIRRAQAACARVAAEEDLLVLPLHGELPADEQDRAVRPADRRKLILSTNVAETSVTIEGVVAVVDSGLARVAGHSPWSGLPALKVGRVSQASAVQRAGRAGRTRPGRCLRLYTAQDFAARPAHETPEVGRLDLAEAVLELRAAGVKDLSEFDWFEAPPAEALAAADSLLDRLGALRGGELTPLGRRMLRLPLHPRLARLVAEGESRGVGREACVVAALIAERDIRRGVELSAAPGAGEPQRRARDLHARHGSSDLLELYDLFAEAARLRFAPGLLRAAGLNPNAVRHVERARRQLQNLTSGARRKGEDGGAQPLSAEQEEALLISVLAGYPDRVARRRDFKVSGSETPELLLSGGGAARLAPESVVRGREFLVAVEAEERKPAGREPAALRGAQVLVRLASAVEPEWLLDLFTDSLAERTEARWNSQAERAEVWGRLVYDQLVIDEWRAKGGGREEAARVLAAAALDKGPAAFVEPEALERFLARVEFVARAFPDANFTAVGGEEVLAALGEMCEGRRSFAELREAARAGELFERLRARLSPEQSRLLAQMAPERVTLAGGRQARVSYEAGREPFIASRLQDFFGMREGPRLAGGRVRVVLHLLAPNQRPVQVTTDLAGFWEREYPRVRRELGRRYPRHAWPEDPLRNNPRG